MNDEQDTLAMIWSGRWLPWLPERLQPPAARLVIYASLAMLAILIAPVFDATGGDALDASFKRTLAALAATRGLDSAISLAQSSEISFSFGPGGSIGIGQALDPVNDLVEQYASLLLTSTTALGVQQLGMRIGRSIGAWLFLPSLTALALAVAARGATQATLMGWGRRLFALALFARLAVPAAAWIDAVIAERFLEGSYQEASTAVAATTERIEQAEAAGAEKPWYERYNPVKTVGDRAQQIYESMAGVTESIVNLAIYFTIATIVLPVGTLWLLSKAVGTLFASRGG
ncbi:MAG: hypothetical protein O3A37_14970 [Planctomycetota bacterium]|nr:hypothetical protein [Planctomycetota bacterium]